MKILICLFFILAPLLASAEVLRIMPLGDSLTAGGYNASGKWYEGSGYRKRLEELLDSSQCPFQFVGSLSTPTSDIREKNHEGHSGWKIEEVRSLVPQLQGFKPHLILLMIGTNDIFKNDHLGQAPSRLLRLINDIYKYLPETQIVVGTILRSSSPFANQAMDRYNNEMTKLIKAHPTFGTRLFVSDIRNTSKIEATTDDLGDGVHPTDLGYHKLGNAWYEAIAKLPILQVACRNQTRE